MKASCFSITRTKHNEQLKIPVLFMTYDGGLVVLVKCMVLQTTVIDNVEKCHSTE